MTLSQLPKAISSRVILALFLIVQLAACSNSKDLAVSITDDISTTDDNTTENTAAPEDPTVPAAVTDINLSWSAPSQRENNEPISLSEIAGYKIYYGTTSRNYPNKINISNATSDGYTVKNISS